MTADNAAVVSSGTVDAARDAIHPEQR